MLKYVISGNFLPPLLTGPSRSHLHLALFLTRMPSVMFRNHLSYLPKPMHLSLFLVKVPRELNTQTVKEFGICYDLYWSQLKVPLLVQWFPVLTINFLPVLLKEKNLFLTVLYVTWKNSLNSGILLVLNIWKPWFFCCSYLLITACQSYNPWQNVPLVFWSSVVTKLLQNVQPHELNNLLPRKFPFSLEHGLWVSSLSAD